jgi:DNA transposition AAA+ family ATPase
MADDPDNQTPEGGEPQESVRARVRAVMTAEGLTMTAIAKEADIAYGTFSAWMGGTYAGRGDRVADAAARWLEARKAANRTKALAPAAPDFQMTASAGQFFALFEHAQYVPDFGIITGGAGVGKTSAVCAYRARTPGVFVLTAEPCLSTTRALLDELREVTGVEERYSAQTISRALVAKLRGSGALVIVDEAQHLATAALDQLRTLHDKAGIGVALVGNETVYARLEGVARQPAYAQLFSRVGMRVARPRPERADVETLLDAWGIGGDRERKLLHVIGRKPGALRGLTKTLRIAHMLAGAAGDALEAKYVQAAWARLSSTEIGEAA